MSAPLSVQQLAEIRERREHAQEIAERADWILPQYQAVRAALSDVPALLAQVEQLDESLAYLETTAGLVSEYRVPLSEDAWLVVRREPCGDRWAVLGSHLKNGRRPIWVGGRWVTLPVVGPDGAWVYESARAALDTAVGLAAKGGESCG